MQGSQWCIVKRIKSVFADKRISRNTVWYTSLLSQVVLSSSIKSISGNTFLSLVFPKACIPSRIRLKFEFESAYNRLLTNLNSTFAKSVNLTLNLVFLKLMNFEFKSNLPSYSLNYAEACNELAGPTCASLSPGNSASFEEMLHLWQAFDNTVPNLTGLRFDPQTYRSGDERVTAGPTGLLKKKIIDPTLRRYIKFF